MVGSLRANAISVGPGPWALEPACLNLNPGSATDQGMALGKLLNFSGLPFSHL